MKNCLRNCILNSPHDSLAKFHLWFVLIMPYYCLMHCLPPRAAAKTSKSQNFIRPNGGNYKSRFHKYLHLRKKFFLSLHFSNVIRDLFTASARVLLLRASHLRGKKKKIYYACILAAIS
jgi:hypothetical protein